MTLNDRLALVCQTAHESIDSHYHKLRVRLTTYQGTPVGFVIERLLEWQTGTSLQRSLLWEVFNEALDLNPRQFMASVDSFVGNYLLDDSSFRIEWRVTDVTPNFVTTKNVEVAKPVVVLDNNGIQDANALLEAMDIAERRATERIARAEAAEAKIKMLTAAIRSDSV